ncbi:MAG: hypothetical protein HFI64_08635 [Lachnospiraceae bacterium]|nr:hypothetical protein [Lachnospiraceae bacterium]
MENSIYQSGILYNQLKQLNLCRIFPHTVIKHVLIILISVFSSGCTGSGTPVSFEDGYAYFYRRLQEERIADVYQCGKKQIPLADVLALVA